MHDSIQPARLTRSRRGHLLAVALPLLSGVLVAGCTGSSAGPATTAATGPAPSGAVSGCLVPPATCSAPHLVQVAYGIQPLLARGIDGRGETVTVVASPPPPGEAGSANSCTNPPCPPATTDIRQDLKAFDSMFGLTAARIQVVTGLAG